MTTSRAGHPEMDWGRVAVVPLLALTLVLNCVVAVRAPHGGTAGSTVAGLAASVGTILFQALVISSYLRRGRASATTTSVTARWAALVATWLPFAVLPLLGIGQSPAENVAASALIGAGMAVAVWGIVALGTNVSVFAQTRELATQGPYRLVRHPLYLGEVVAFSGVALHTGRSIALLLIPVLAALQAYRARHEERLLAATLPGYPQYQSRTAALVPGVL